MEIAENIRTIAEKIHSINPDCRIVAATKTRTLEEIRKAMDTGLILAAGENRVQELIEKFVPDFRWDFIGVLQTNKVKYIIDKVALIHSMDRLSLAEAVEKESAKHGKITDVLIEINSGKEETKSGIYLEDAEKFSEQLSVYPHIRVCGMMAVAPLYYGQDELRRTFDEVYSTYARLKSDVFRYLSMGMSNDYLTAVECGANLVRLGRAIFGERRVLQCSDMSGRQ